ncbi:sodium:proton antiporter [Caulobacter sp. UNC279MFTsu5.1]|uniref:cation:proton antiporter n=1 Tax=Caulobacter sp. UNC279MFTsu5.1 TaxID=1502775 RepID=UPI0008E648F0|nr:sodium:proton antiporter [Caulobacter sp. UNC279MFTsu5.1]SFI60076.1 monovalent cation:H+ antiporter, CPA1 family [Caulobacter sp. UNC279MFTsu5.1]
MPSLSAFDAAAIVIVLVALLGYLNHRFFRLAPSIALTVMGALASIVVVAADRISPGRDLSGHVREFLGTVDFQTALMDGMLSFLLFAGALHVSLEQVRAGRGPILALSTVGVVLSTVLIAAGFKAVSLLVGLDAPLAWCLVFGALISPTDPVAVLGILKAAKVPKLLEATVGGESLFNDGVGVVVFSILLAAATSHAPLTLGHAALLFAHEAGGGVLLGLVVGYVAFRAMRSIDNYNVEVMISLAVVMGGYALARPLHVSGPVAMAVAGLLIGNHGVALAMSDTTKDYLLKFWSLIDDILNAALFLLIGLEGVALSWSPGLLLAGVLAVPMILLARLLSTAPILALWRRRLPLRLSVPILTWGALRGGISIALALSLPGGPMKDLIVATTYVVVLFSVVVQGSTMAGLVRRLPGSSRP